MKALAGLIILFFLGMTTTAGAIECRHKPQHNGKHWTYRQIDGARCWYPGRRHLAKSRLHWPEPSKTTAPPARADISPADRAEALPKTSNADSTGVWPTLPHSFDVGAIAKNFRDRWNALQFPPLWFGGR